FGREVVRFKAPGQGEKEVEEVFEYVDRVLIEGIDALDNGMRLDDGRISIMSITSIISGFNPPWDSDMAEDKAFDIVVELVSSVLSNTIDNRLSVLRAREKVINAYHHREIAELLKLDVYCPYGETLQEVDKNKEVLFVVYPRKDSYAIQTVRDFGREDRKKLPEAWAGLRDEELAELTRVEDAVFCHSGRFIAVAESYEGIMKLARMAIEEQDAGLEEEPGEAPSEKWAMKLIRRILSRR
ncbi:MAG: MYG1 family protein, partial [Bacillota bacterium]|nr:MYG1 family protein [Bacillota bacterium]